MPPGHSWSVTLTEQESNLGSARAGRFAGQTWARPSIHKGRNGGPRRKTERGQSHGVALAKQDPNPGSLALGSIPGSQRRAQGRRDSSFRMAGSIAYGLQTNEHGCSLRGWGRG